VGANLSGTNLRGADLTGAVLQLPIPEDASPDFSYQNLTGDELAQALLSQPDMAKIAYDPIVAELNETTLKENLEDAILQGVSYDENTIWPLGYELPPSAILYP